MGATFELPGSKWTRDLDMSTIPNDVLYAEVGRRRGAQRKSYTGGVLWAKHNSKVNNCRCVKCMEKRRKAKEPTPLDFPCTVRGCNAAPGFECRESGPAHSRPDRVLTPIGEFHASRIKRAKDWTGR
jgi:hypothetical protein